MATAGAGTGYSISLSDWPISASQENQLLAHLMPSLTEEMALAWSPKAHQVEGQSRASYQARSNLHWGLPVTINAFPEALTEELEFIVLCLNVFYHAEGNYMEPV